MTWRQCCSFLRTTYVPKSNPSSTDVLVDSAPMPYISLPTNMIAAYILQGHPISGGDPPYIYQSDDLIMPRCNTTLDRFWVPVDTKFSQEKIRYMQGLATDLIDANSYAG